MCQSYKTDHTGVKKMKTLAKPNDFITKMLVIVHLKKLISMYAKFAFLFTYKKLYALENLKWA